MEAVTREAPPGTGEDVLAALGAGGVAESWHTTYLNENDRLRYCGLRCTFRLSRNVRSRLEVDMSAQGTRAPVIVAGAGPTGLTLAY